MIGRRPLWRAWLSEAAATAIIDAAARAYPVETGGVLVGVLAKNRPWITSAEEVTSATSARSYYRLPANARRS